MWGHFRYLHFKTFPMVFWGAQIGACLPFSTKILNIWNFHTSVTPNMGVHLRVIGLNFLHSPPLVKVCFTIEHTLLASCAFALHN
jgi:hypothetical protein